MTRRTRSADESIPCWCGTCGKKFWGGGTLCPRCREIERARRASADPATGSSSAEEISSAGRRR
jgi:hypothetical protein